MTIYKLTNQKMATNYSQFQWELGKTETLPYCDNPRLCTSDVFHAYTDPDLALVLNPVHANIANPRLFEAEGEVVVEHWDKVGTFELTLTRELPLPEWYTDPEQRSKVAVVFANLCASAAAEAADAAFATYAATYDADASDAAARAARAARAAARAARAAEVAAYAATYAARAAAEAAEAATYGAAIDFVALIKQAIKEVTDDHTTD